MNRVCVFAGSSRGARPEYIAAARDLGTALARRRMGVVNWGARVGLMGALADAALAEAPPWIGVIPRPWSRRQWPTTA
jgi:predicted Rossmann-fold nucleotide-binding protein